MNQRLKFAQELAVAAGKVLMKYEKQLGRLEVHSKQAQGVASTADIESEKLIKKQIQKSFPEDLVLGEESYFADVQRLGAGKRLMQKYELAPATWIVDPLDGTHNYLNRFDYYSVCIAFVAYGVAQLGLVYRPKTGECFWAIRGKGACKGQWNGSKFGKVKKIGMPNNPKSLKESILVTGFATEKGKTIEEEFRFFKRVIGQSRAIRRLGSAALDLCYVSEGIFDGFWERGLAPWDVAAAGLICQEAGVKVTDFSGGEFSPFDKTILASRSPLHAKIRKLF